MTLLVGLSMCGSTLVSEFDFDGISGPVFTRPIEITIIQWDSLLNKHITKQYAYSQNLKISSEYVLTFVKFVIIPVKCFEFVTCLALLSRREMFNKCWGHYVHVLKWDVHAFQ